MQGEISEICQSERFIVGWVYQQRIIGCTMPPWMDSRQNWLQI